MDLVVSALLSGSVAATFAILASRVIEKLGGMWGGIFATLPFVITPAALGLAYNLKFPFGKIPDGSDYSEETEKLTSTMFTIPIGTNTLFVLRGPEHVSCIEFLY